MSVDFEALLSLEQKVSILEQRIAQFAGEAWQHSLNRETCLLVGDDAGVAAAESALEVLSAAVQVHQLKLAEVSAG